MAKKWSYPKLKIKLFGLATLKYPSEHPLSFIFREKSLAPAKILHSHSRSWDLKILWWSSLGLNIIFLQGLYGQPNPEGRVDGDTRGNYANPEAWLWVDRWRQVSASPSFCIIKYDSFWYQWYPRSRSCQKSLKSKTMIICLAINPYWSIKFIYYYL